MTLVYFLHGAWVLFTVPSLSIAARRANVEMERAVLHVTGYHLD